MSNKLSFEKYVCKCETIKRFGENQRLENWSLKSSFSHGWFASSFSNATCGSTPFAMLIPHAVAVEREMPAWQWTKTLSMPAPNSISSATSLMVGAPRPLVISWKETTLWFGCPKSATSRFVGPAVITTSYWWHRSCASIMFKTSGMLLIRLIWVLCILLIIVSIWNFWTFCNPLWIGVFLRFWRKYPSDRLTFLDTPDNLSVSSNHLEKG